VDSALRAHLSEILADPTDALLRKRYERFRAIGEFIEKPRDRLGGGT
jgi:acetyl-CoA carboxylase alpha subunit